MVGGIAEKWNWSNEMPMRAELPIAVTRTRNDPSALDRAWSWIIATIKNPEFLAVTLFCAVGLWLTFYFMHYFPDYGAMSASLQAFP
jgi:hypothetical protein